MPSLHTFGNKFSFNNGGGTVAVTAGQYLVFRYTKDGLAQKLEVETVSQQH
jgi:hypothetical protein